MKPITLAMRYSPRIEPCSDGSIKVVCRLASSLTSRRADWRPVFVVGFEAIWSDTLARGSQRLRYDQLSVLRSGAVDGI